MRPEERFERELAETRQEEPDPRVLQAAAARVWRKIREELPEYAANPGALRSCAGFQALIPSHRAGSLSEARELLLADHVRECVACRKALMGESQAAVHHPAPRPWWNPRWAVAAGLAVAVGLSALALYRPDAGRVTVETAGGKLFRVSGGQVAPVPVGEELDAAGELRTAKDTGAVVRLRDGSTVEMRERTAFTVSESGPDTTVHLARGAVIVEAAKRRFGRLYVATRDCRVAVTGTVFSVSSGVKGSRVAVIEGEVRVAQGSAEAVVRAGGQYATGSAMTPVELRDEISWSRNFDRYAALLKQFKALEKELESVRLPGLRYASRLMNRLPAGVALVASLPNMGPALAESSRILQQQLAQSPELREWWNSASGARGVPEAVAHLQALSEYLGEEIVVAAAADSRGRLQSPVILAEVRRAGIGEYVRAALAKAGAREPVPMVVRDGIVAAGAAPLSALEGGFAGTPLGERVAEAYRGGAGLLLAVDLEKLHPAKDPSGSALRLLVVEQKQAEGRTGTQATLSFAGASSGPAAWLAAPAPIGALDFISPEAGMAAAFVVKNPARVLEDLIASSNKVPPEVRGFAASLGGEFAFALDGGVLPVPLWRLAAEVYDPPRLQASIERVVEMANAEAAREGRKGIEIRRETLGGRLYYVLSAPETAKFATAAYTFAGGYLVAAPSPSMVERAIENRASGYSLGRSSEFANLLPRDSQPNFSGMFYQNLGPALAPLAELAGSLEGLNAGQRKTVESAAGKMKPLLVTLYAGRDSIRLASGSDLLAITPARLLSLQGPMGLAGMLGGFGPGKKQLR